MIAKYGKLWEEDPDIQKVIKLEHKKNEFKIDSIKYLLK